MEDSKDTLPNCHKGNIISNRIIQYVACLIVTLHLLSSGMHYGWPSPSLPILLSSDSPIQMTSSDSSWLAIIFLIGAAIGSCLAGLLLSVVGRKYTILLASSALFVSWIIIAFAQSLTVLIIARFVAGLAEGMSFCCIPCYIGEIADKEIRGFLATVLTTGSLIGVFMVNIIGSYLTIKMSALIFSTIPFITFATFLWMPESPHFLLMKNKTEQARHSLKILKGVDDVEQEMDNIEQFISKEATSIGKYWKLFNGRSNRKALLIVLGIRAVQQCSGATAITLYAQIIFAEAGTIISPVTSSSIYFGTLVISTIISSMLIDRIGRRPLLIVSTVGVGISLLIESIYFYLHSGTYSGTNELSLISVIALIVFVLFFGIGLQTIPIVMESEMFETKIKSFAICVSDMSFSVIGALASKLFQYMKDELELYLPFLIFSICSALGLVLILYIVPETKGKTLETIQLELMQEKDKSPTDSKSTQQP